MPPGTDSLRSTESIEDISLYAAVRDPVKQKFKVDERHRKLDERPKPEVPKKTEEIAPSVR